MSSYTRLRPVLFRLDPERAHVLTLDLLALAGAARPLRAWLRWRYRPSRPQASVQAFGLTFPNVLGLAAGFDKDGRALRGLACLGFGHVELGTVTPEPQAGRAKPRLFRLEEDQALINRLGFPSAGADRLHAVLKRGRPPGVVVGVNIGMGADTALEDAAEDYLSLLRRFHAHADYLTVNISSPNTIGLRRLQDRERLEALLKLLVSGRREQVAATGRRVPVLVKIGPDLEAGALEQAVGVIQDAGMDGVVATNTTLSRPALRSRHAGEEGGLSGRPLRERSTEVIRRVHELSRGRLPIVGAGGVFGPDDAREKLDAGAVLVQLYTGLVYQGPGLAKRILDGLGRADPPA